MSSFWVLFSIFQLVADGKLWYEVQRSKQEIPEESRCRNVHFTNDSLPCTCMAAAYAISAYYP